MFLNQLISVFVLLSLFNVHGLLLQPQRQKLANAREMLYQIPKEKNKLNGIIVTLPGCSHSARDFWPKDSETCSDCIGLPVELTFTRKAIESKFVIVALTSQESCWNPAVDMAYVGEAINKMYDILNVKNHLKLPLYIYGISSGGNFAGALAERFHNDLSFKITAMGIHLSHLKMYSKNNPPPTVFLPMTRDSSTYSKNKRNVAELRLRKVATDILPCESMLIKPSYFNEHDERISLKDSELIVSTLLKHNFITESGVLLKDPRVTDWRTKLQEVLPNMNYMPDESPISELLNMAYGMHEISDQHIDGVSARYCLKMYLR